nr:hypothetical protein [Thermobifida fusca]
MADDLGLYLVGGQVWLVADALLSSDAEEVEVGTAVAFGALHDETPVTAGAPDRTLEVVVVLALAGAATVSQGEDALCAVEQLGRDDGRVAAFVFLAFVGDDALVVRVLKHLVEGVQGDRLLGLALGGASGQTGGRDDLMHLLPGVVASGVQLEGFEHERGTLVVEGDGADFAAVDLLADVEVADFGLGDGAAVLGFLAHLVGDVRAAGL